MSFNVKSLIYGGLDIKTEEQLTVKDSLPRSLLFLYLITGSMTFSCLAGNSSIAVLTKATY